MTDNRTTEGDVDEWDLIATGADCTGRRGRDGRHRHSSTVTVRTKIVPRELRQCRRPVVAHDNSTVNKCNEATHRGAA